MPTARETGPMGRGPISGPVPIVSGKDITCKKLSAQEPFRARNPSECAKKHLSRRQLITDCPWQPPDARAVGCTSPSGNSVTLYTSCQSVFTQGASTSLYKKARIITALQLRCETSMTAENTPTSESSHNRHKAACGAEGVPQAGRRPCTEYR